MLQNVASHLGLLCLLLEKIHGKIEYNYMIAPDSPINESGLVQMIMMGQSISHIWINLSSWNKVVFYVLHLSLLL